MKVILSRVSVDAEISAAKLVNDESIVKFVNFISVELDIEILPPDGILNVKPDEPPSMVNRVTPLRSIDSL